MRAPHLMAVVPPGSAPLGVDLPAELLRAAARLQLEYPGVVHPVAVLHHRDVNRLQDVMRRLGTSRFAHRLDQSPLDLPGTVRFRLPGGGAEEASLAGAWHGVAIYASSRAPEVWSDAGIDACGGPVYGWADDVGEAP